MTKKKVKVRVKKRKLKIGRIIICLLILAFLVAVFYYIKKLPIKNIYIIGNKVVPDGEILDISGIKNYPSFIDTSKKEIISKIKNNEYVKSVKVEKKIWGKIYIYIEEKKILCIYNNKLLLEDSSLVDNNYNIYSYPTLISDITNIFDRFVNKFSKVGDKALHQISEIEYTPNEVDNERFSLMMDDGNLVYITLSKVTKINKYNSIYSSMEEKKGIIYLDSGDYIEIKENE